MVLLEDFLVSQECIFRTNSSPRQSALSGRGFVVSGDSAQPMTFSNGTFFEFNLCSVKSTNSEVQLFIQSQHGGNIYQIRSHPSVLMGLVAPKIFAIQYRFILLVFEWDNPAPTGLWQRFQETIANGLRHHDQLMDARPSIWRTADLETLCLLCADKHEQLGAYHHAAVNSSSKYACDDSNDLAQSLSRARVSHSDFKDAADRLEELRQDSLTCLERLSDQLTDAPVKDTSDCAALEIEWMEHRQKLLTAMETQVLFQMLPSRTDPP